MWACLSKWSIREKLRLGSKSNMEFTLLSVPTPKSKRRASDESKSTEATEKQQLTKSISCSEKLTKETSTPSSSKKGSFRRKKKDSLLAPDYLADLTTTQMVALQKSWPKINTRGFKEILKNVFDKVLLREASAAKAFARNLSPAQKNLCRVQTVSDHCEFLIALLSDLIDSINQPSNYIGKTLQEFGRKHAHLLAKCRMNAEVWETFGTVFVEKITSLDGVRQSKDAVSAWRILLAYLTDQLRHGFEQEIKVLRRMSEYGLTTSFDHLQVNSTPLLKRKSSPNIL